METPYESVNKANLHDVLRYADIRRIQAKETERENKRVNKKRNK